MAERTDSTMGDGDAQPGLERAKAILAELADAARSAAVSAANQQKERGAQQIGDIAEAVRAAARSLDRSQSPTAARYADRAAARIEELSRLLRERGWSEMAGDLEGVARRRPAWFAAGALAAGFLAGRLLSVPPSHDKARRASSVDALPPDETVKTAISSAAGNGALAGGIDHGSKPRENP
jgi:hypothetical protein